MKWVLKEIEVGDMVRIPMSEVYHYGVCTGENRIVQFGEPVLTSPKPREEIRVNAVDIETFLGGEFAEVAVFDKKEQKRRRSTEEITDYAEKCIGKGGYDILYNNCEHFANECVFGSHTSQQIDRVRREIEQRMPCINVYIGETEKFGGNDVLPAFARKELKKITCQRTAMEKRAGYGLLKYACDRMDKSPDIRKCYLSKTGKPLHRMFCFSISHSGELTAAAVSSAPIGVDLEVHGNEEHMKRLGELILHKNEKSCTDPLLLWTVKEAAFKFSEAEKKFVPSAVDTTAFNSKSAEFSWKGKSYIISVVGDVLINVHFISEPLEQKAEFKVIKQNE